MKRLAILFTAGIFAGLFAAAQEPAAAPHPGDTNASTAQAVSVYRPPTHAERLRTYVHHTYSLGSILEAGAHAGIDQARGVPGEWPEGAEGYGERFGSALGGIVVRGTTQYALGELFHEDLRYLPCRTNCTTSKFTAALEDTFTAKKGDDGHRAFSFARLLGPVAAGLVVSSWRPGGFGHRDVAKEIGLNYSFVFLRNLAREAVR